MTTFVLWFDVRPAMRAPHQFQGAPPTATGSWLQFFDDPTSPAIPFLRSTPTPKGAGLQRGLQQTQHCDAARPEVFVRRTWLTTVGFTVLRDTQQKVSQISFEVILRKQTVEATSPYS